MPPAETRAKTRADERRQAWPPVKPHADGFLPVSDGHRVYFEECGNPDGNPVLMVHGGPGGGCNPAMRRLHDPNRWRIILFDQRGCGRSTPHADLTANTTWHLVADMERLREHLNIERWHLFGGSWGSALSLAYAERHPDRVCGLILRGIFTLRQCELTWFYQHGAHALYPDAWERFIAPIPAEERGDLIGAYHRRLTGDDEAEQLHCARAWSLWEGTTLSLLPNPGREANFTNDHYALAFARIESHYFINGGFFDRDDQLLADAGVLQEIPGVLVHGRHDVVTPLMTAWALKAVWPKVSLEIVPDAGHAADEPGIVDQLVRATDRFADIK